jgi:hypothetical protein
VSTPTRSRLVVTRTTSEASSLAVLAMLGGLIDNRSLLLACSDRSTGYLMLLLLLLLLWWQRLLLLATTVMLLLLLLLESQGNTLGLRAT